MTQSRARRQPSRGKAAGSGLLAPERPRIVTGVLPPDPVATQPDPEPEKEEVVIEPDLPADDAPPHPHDEEAAAQAKPDPEVPALSDEELAEAVEEPFDPKAEYNELVAAMKPDEPVYVARNRPPRLKVGAYFLEPGDVVPGAHHWPRREAYERLGRIERR